MRSVYPWIFYEILRGRGQSAHKPSAIRESLKKNGFIIKKEDFVQNRSEMGYFGGLEEEDLEGLYLGHWSGETWLAGSGT